MNRLRHIATLSVLAASLLILSACAGTRSFYRQTPPGVTHVTAVQYAKKVQQHFNAVGTEIVALRSDPTVSTGSKSALLDGYRKGVCSDLERNTAVKTTDCRQGPAWQADRAIAAYEGLANAQTEAEMQAASDALFGLLSDLIDLIANAR